MPHKYLSIVFFSLLAHIVYSQVPTPSTYLTQKDYEFTYDMLSGAPKYWKKVAEQLRGKPNLRYLEIGVYEGASLFWMFENILTDPTSKATVVDIFEASYYNRFMRNLEKSGCRDRVEVLKGDSTDVLKKLSNDTFDLIYVDGGHMAYQVLTDAVLSWNLLKIGGFIVFDDYQLDSARMPVENRPQVAIDAFLTAYRNAIKVVEKGWQVVVQKKDPKYLPHSLTPLSNRVFNWSTLTLEDTSNQKIEISDADQKFIINYIKSRSFGSVDFPPAKDRKTLRKLLSLSKRYQLSFQ